MSIVREHGGSMDVETLPAGGSAFTVYLPAAPDEVSGAPIERAIPAADVPPAVDILHGRSILVVDDEESIRMLLDEGLSAHGMHVECAANSAQALELIRKRAFDVALCDVNLAPGQGTSGRETAQQIAAFSYTGARPEIVFMTGDLVEENGDGDHVRQLQKPFRISDVLAVLREVLAARPAEKLQ